jgi:2-isopropylmalate synthase
VPYEWAVVEITGEPTPRNKLIIGRNAFAHQSGIHQDGVLKNAATDEVMKPEQVGAVRSSLVLGKHSGQHALRYRLAEIGEELTDSEFRDLTADFGFLPMSLKRSMIWS